MESLNQKMCEVIMDNSIDNIATQHTQQLREDDEEVDLKFTDFSTYGV